MEVEAILDTLLAEPTLEAATGTASEKYRDNAFNRLRTSELRQLLNERGVAFPEDRNIAKLIASYIVESAFYLRKGDVARASKIQEQMRRCMHLRNVNFLTERTTAMTTEETNPETTTETPARKRSKKGATAKKASKKATPATKRAKHATKEAAEPSARGGANDTRKLKLLVKENPKREGSASYDRYELYRGAKTVADFVTAGGLMADVRYDQAKGYIEVAE